MIVIPNSQKCQTVSKQIDRRHRVLYHRPRKSNQQPILHHSGHIHRQCRCLPHKQKYSQIQGKCAEGIGTEYHKIKLKPRIVLQYGQLHENPGHQQKHQTTRRNVVERSDGVERNALAGQQNLDQDQPSRLKGNRTQLKTNPPGIKSGLAVGGNGDAERYGEHVTHGVGLESLFLEDDADGVDGDGHEGFEHLDEGDGEVNVGGIGEPEAKGVESADGDDGGDVELTRH